MSTHTRETLETMLEDVVSELALSDAMIERHRLLGTPPAELVREVLQGKDAEIQGLKQDVVSLPSKVTFVLSWALRLLLLGILVMLVSLVLAILADR